MQVFLEIKTLEFNNHRLWSNVQLQLCIFQTLQAIEVVHCIVALVPSSPVIAAQQAFTKILIVWGVIVSFPTSQHSLGILLTVLCWSIAESTRYLYYSLNIVNKLPYLLTWCRYSFFLILYPIGVIGELLIIYSSLDEISKNPSLSYPLPNVLNFSIYYHIFLIFFTVLYIPCKFF